MRYPGEVWFLPQEARDQGDAKARRHVLLTPCREAGDVATLAYASTKPKDAVLGGANVRIEPVRTTYGAAGLTGFSLPTFVYPCRLVSTSSDEMERMVGRLIDEMAEVRLKLSHALGIGTGSCDGPGPAKRSWRGTVVRFTDALVDETDIRYGVLITEPAYSNRRRYQIFVPLLNEEEYEPDELDVHVADDWLRRLEPRWTSGIFAIRWIQTAFHAREIASWTGLAVADPLMELIDDALRALFQL